MIHVLKFKILKNTLFPHSTINITNYNLIPILTTMVGPFSMCHALSICFMSRSIHMHYLSIFFFKYCLTIIFLLKIN